MTNETAKFIEILNTWHGYAPDKPLPDLLTTALQLLQGTSDKRRPTRLRKAKAAATEPAA